MVDAEMTCRDFGKLPCTLVQLTHHLRRRSLLWSKDTGCTILSTKRILYVGGYRESHVLQFLEILPSLVLREGIDNGTKHSHSCIARRTAAKSYDDMFGTFTNGINH